MTHIGQATMTSRLQHLIDERHRLRTALSLYQFADRWTREEYEEMRLINISIANLSNEIAEIQYSQLSDSQKQEEMAAHRARFDNLPTVSDAVNQIKEFYENRDRKKP